MKVLPAIVFLVVGCCRDRGNGIVELGRPALLELGHTQGKKCDKILNIWVRTAMRTRRLWRSVNYRWHFDFSLYCLRDLKEWTFGTLPKNSLVARARMCVPSPCHPSGGSSTPAHLLNQNLSAGPSITSLPQIPARRRSSRSLLDGDALLVARKSLGPIIFIAINVEGGRFFAWGLFAAFAAAAAVAISRASSICGRHESRESRAATRTRARRRTQSCTNRYTGMFETLSSRYGDEE